MSARKKNGSVSNNLNSSFKSQNDSKVNSNFNFRLQNDAKLRAEAKGTKPLPQPVSVGGACLTMFIHVCRRIIFINTNYKLVAYMAVMFFSLVCDYYPFPKSYFSQSSNIPNQYFVKLGWAWTLLLTIPFVFLTCFTYCCGNRRMVGNHLLRLAIATVNWFIFTKSFAYLENNTGKCSVRGEKFMTKQTCLGGGHFWHSLDISGHAFILIYSSLVIVEEAKAIIGWETIDDLIRNEDHNRATNETDLTSPLKSLSKEELGILKLAFKTFTPWVRGIFIAMTLLVVLWDVMIVSTALYFHIMIEKLSSAFLAIVVWFFTYRFWFSKTKMMPYAPGQGIFQYNKTKVLNGLPPKTATSRQRPDVGPSFMGMPLYAGRSQQADAEEEVSSVSKGIAAAAARSPGSSRQGPITRSQSRGDVTL